MTEKTSINVFSFFISQLTLSRWSNGCFKENYHFLKFQGVGPNIFLERIQWPFPIEMLIIDDFSWGGDLDPLSTS